MNSAQVSAKARMEMKRREEEIEQEEMEGGELNLVPYLDIVTNVMLFLLATVTSGLILAAMICARRASPVKVVPFTRMSKRYIIRVISERGPHARSSTQAFNDEIAVARLRSSNRANPAGSAPPVGRRRRYEPGSCAGPAGR